MRRRILFLTNPRNGSPDEDTFLVGKLRMSFDIIVAHPMECESHLSEVEGIVIRNIWPTHEYSGAWEALCLKIRKLGIPTYNPLVGKSDNTGKGYLLDLYKDKFPVIPSVSRIEEIGLLGNCGSYWIKPFDSCDGIGAQRLSKEELLKLNPIDYIIQPYIEFTSEPSLFYIDNQFSYAVTSPNRLKYTTALPYTPTTEYLAWAQRFVDWNALPYGIQRVDAVKAKSGELLLTEVEDIAPYLYLLYGAADGEKAASELVESIKRALR